MIEREIFIAALEFDDASARDAYLDRVCDNNSSLRMRIDKLLANQNKADQFLAKPAVESQGTRLAELAFATDGLDVNEQPDQHIGQYRLVQPLGQGGMGMVWLADQEQPVKRKVALKLIKAGMDTQQVLARFEAERQALALMDHTNIAKVFDAGRTTVGRPYFVMELIQGIPITQFCDQQNLTIPERIELFIPIALAVQHAHQKGIIHRDLKPSNILVTTVDGKPVPKIIDFGVAKAISQKLSDATVATVAGMLIGTPEYMAPEQTQFDNLDTDTRADIYSLGVVLYEILVGSPPFGPMQIRATSFGEMLRVIREVDPPKPSTQLSRIGSDSPIATSRRIDRKKLVRLVRGDLDWIVMKCLEKERTRRYASASQLAADLQHFLLNEPVSAGPPTTSYRLKKFLRRHRGPVIAASVVILSLLAGIIATGLQWKRAEGEKDIAQAVKRFLIHDLLGQTNPRKHAEAQRLLFDGSTKSNPNPTVKELLDQTASQITPVKLEARFPNQPMVQAEILRTIAETYFAVGDNAKAVELFERCRDLLRATLGPDHPDTLSTQLDLAVTYGTAGRLPESIALFETIRDKRKQVLGSSDPQILSIQHNLASAYLKDKQFDKAIELFEIVRDNRVKDLGADAILTLTTLSNLGDAYGAANRLPEAIECLRKAHSGMERTLGIDHPDTITVANNLAFALEKAGQSEIALPILVQAAKGVEKIGFRHRDAEIIMQGVVLSYERIGQLDHAERWRRAWLEAVKEKAGAQSPTYARDLAGLAGNLLRQSKFKDAEKALRESLDIYKHAAPDDWRTANTMSLLGEALLGQKLFAEGESFVIGGYESLTQRRESIPESVRNLRVSQAANRVLAMYEQWGKPDEVAKWREKLK